MLVNNQKRLLFIKLFNRSCFQFPKLSYHFSNLCIYSTLQAMVVNSRCVAYCFTACMNNRVIVHGNCTVACGHHPLFSAIDATFRAAVG